MGGANMSSVIIVGGGASGLVAAILIGREGISVRLLERNSRVGRKILASGNGKCNIGNRYITPDRYHSRNPEFVAAVLAGYSCEAVEAFFDSIGLPLIEGEEGKMFPMSMQASSVVKLLEYEAERVGVKIVCDCAVESMRREGERFVLETSQGREEGSVVLLSAGSPAAPQLGGDVRGMNLAESLGQRLLPAYPSLVQLVSDEKWVKQASGVKVSGRVKLYSNGSFVTERSGDLLFANYGISGLAILDISREVSLQLAEYAWCELHLDLFPQMSKEKLTQFLLHRIHKESHKALSLWLTGVINEKLIPVIVEQSGCKTVKEGSLDRKAIGSLVYAMKNLKLSICDTRGFKGAEVATGGVDTLEVDAETMASRKVKNLYFAGEILDVDGDRGGFNFHFAWVSGMRAAKAIVNL